jgi:hypothetical protein
MQKITPSEIVSYAIHQDNLMWSRLQTLGIVQVAALSGAYALRADTGLALSVLALGVVFTMLLLFLLKRDQLMRDKLEEQVPDLDYGVHRCWCAPLKGREVASLLFAGLFIVDIVLGVAIYYDWLP